MPSPAVPSSRLRASRPSADLSPAQREDVWRRMQALGPWFHNVEILPGMWTAPGHFLGDHPAAQWRRFSHALPADLTGRSVLDIGCNAGFHALEMKARGAARVVAIDEDPRYLAQARLLAEVRGAEIEFRQMSVYDVAALGERFDLVLFLGVLYHLRHPLLALDLIHAHVARDLLVFQSMLRGSPTVADVAPDHDFADAAPFDDPGYPRLHFVERRYCGDPTNWWIPNRAGVEAMLRAAGFAILDRPEAEVYLCRRRAIPAEGTA